VPTGITFTVPDGICHLGGAIKTQIQKRIA
jgi:hypothetical protein